MRSIGKPYVSEKLSFEPLYKENYSESIEQIQPKQNSRRNKKSQAAYFGPDQTENDLSKQETEVLEEKLAILQSKIILLREFDPGSG